MTVEDDLYALCAANAALVAAVGDRIYPDKLDQDCAYPAIAYRLVSVLPFPAMGSDTRNHKARYQFDVWDSDFTTAKATALLLRKALRRKALNLVEQTFPGSMQQLTDDDANLCGFACDFTVWYFEE